MLPHGAISCGVCVHTSTHTHTHTHTHKQMLLDLRRKISAARVTSPLYKPRYLAKVSLPVSKPHFTTPCLGHYQLAPTSPNALGYAYLWVVWVCTPTHSHAHARKHSLGTHTSSFFTPYPLTGFLAYAVCRPFLRSCRSPVLLRRRRRRRRLSPRPFPSSVCGAAGFRAAGLRVVGIVQNLWK